MVSHLSHHQLFEIEIQMYVSQTHKCLVAWVLCTYVCMSMGSMFRVLIALLHPMRISCAVFRVPAIHKSQLSYVIKLRDTLSVVYKKVYLLTMYVLYCYM